MTRYAALLIGLVIVSLGALGLLQPDTFVSAVKFFQTGKNLYIAAAIRLVIGGVLFVAAEDARWPRVLRALALVVIVMGLLTVASTHPLPSVAMGWYKGEYVRPWALTAAAFGLFIVVSVVPPRDLQD